MTSKIKEYTLEQANEDISAQTENLLAGDKISFCAEQFEAAKKIYEQLEANWSCQKKDSDLKIVVSLFGGSGSGKTGFSRLLASFFQLDGFESLVVSGDNYPKRIPVENDARRNELFVSGGKEALEAYLGSYEEIDYEAINELLLDFKSGAKEVNLRKLGTKPGELSYTKTDVSSTRILILEWTHGGNRALKNVDCRIYLHCSRLVAEKRRFARKRNANYASPLISACIDIEGKMLETQALSADFIFEQNGSQISRETFERRIKPFSIKPMFNAYPDSMGENLSFAADFLSLPVVKAAFSDFYILPSLFHSDLDRGFSVIDYDLDENLARPEDLKKIKGIGINLKLDFVLNHLSVNSPQFQDLLLKGKNSEYYDFFIPWNDFWSDCGQMTEEGYIQPKKEYTDIMFFRKPGLPILTVEFADGTRAPFWNTFYQEKKINPDGSLSYKGQMDLNIKSTKVQEFYKETLKKLASYGTKILRLDAFAYAPKSVGAKNFLNEPDTWDFLAQIQEWANPYGMTLLPEIHASYSEKIYKTLSDKGYVVYDFFLPGLILDALETHDGQYLVSWANEIIENDIKTVNMLGCHDGIPVLDLKGLVPEVRIEKLIETVKSRGGFVKDLHGAKNIYYQINATYFSALGEDKAKMLLARAIQMFMPGKPQVWYLDLFAGKNDIEAMKRAGEGGHKEINRTNITQDFVRTHFKDEIVEKQMQLLRMRNSFGAFSADAKIEISLEGSDLKIIWKKGDYTAVLDANLETYLYRINLES